LTLSEGRSSARLDGCWHSRYVNLHASGKRILRVQRIAILGSPLNELTGFYLAIDCLTPVFGGELT
jgi:hypothetical protein